MRVALAALVALLVPAVAQAHYSSTSRMHNIRHVATWYYGPDVCDVGTMNVPIVRANIGAGRGRAVRDGVPGGTPIPATPPPPREPLIRFPGCVIYVNDEPWISTEQLCALVAGHEYGHLFGLDHVYGDPANIMSPDVPPWVPCELQNIRRIARSFPRPERPSMSNPAPGGAP
jgi:hypothetical protein